MNEVDVDVRNLPPGVEPISVVEGNGVVYTLNIVGRSEYNGIQVVGVAAFFNGSPQEETEPPAILHGLS